MNYQISFWPTVAAAISSLVLGGLWYGPLFGKVWMKEMGWDQNDQAKMAGMKRQAKWSYGFYFLLNIITALVLAKVLAVFGASNLSDALKIGFFMWLGFFFPVISGGKLWNNRPLKGVGIDLAFQLVMICIMALILVSWR